MITSLVLSIRFFNVALFFIPLIAIISYIWAEVEARAIIKDPTPDTILILDDNDKQEVKVKHMINLGNNVVGLTKFGDDDYRAVTYGYVKNMKAID
jgi:hypothetical protein